MAKAPILGDHKRIRKKLIPPLLQLGTMRLTSWVDVGLPEVLWLALLHDRLGLERTVPLVVKLTEVIASRSHTSILFVSDFTSVTAESLQSAAATLSSSDRALLDDALSLLLRLYPECPLGPLRVQSVVSEPTEDDVAWIKTLVAHLIDRTSHIATMAQASTVYLAKLQHRFSSFDGSSLSNFAEIENYPATTESQRVASGVRRMLNMLIFKEQPAEQDAWSRYFWNRSFQLEPCYFSKRSFDDSE